LLQIGWFEQHVRCSGTSSIETSLSTPVSSLSDDRKGHLALSFRSNLREAQFGC
jgi:hypothetical protein